MEVAVSLPAGKLQTQPTSHDRRANPLAQIVANTRRRPGALDRLGLDYCCHGDRALAAACAEADLDSG